MDAYHFSSWRTLLKSYTEQGQCYLNIIFFLHDSKRESAKIIKDIIEKVSLGDAYHLVFVFKERYFIGKVEKGIIYFTGDFTIANTLLRMDNNEHENLTKTMRSAYLNEDYSFVRVNTIDKKSSKRNWKAEAWDINGLLFKTEERNLEDIKNLGCAYLVLNEKNKTLG